VCGRKQEERRNFTGGEESFPGIPMENVSLSLLWVLS
jgi:hypothetical protein